MKLCIISVNNAEERLNVLRPRHWEALQSLLEELPHWDEPFFTKALNGLGWTEHRVPLNIFNAERLDWEKSSQGFPYGKVRYSLFSYEWLQEAKTAFFMFCRRFGFLKNSTGRFTYAGKKGMGLMWASGKNASHILRLIYTDFPLLYDMNKLGVGLLLIHSCPAALAETLQKASPLSKLPLMAVILSKKNPLGA